MSNTHMDDNRMDDGTEPRQNTRRSYSQPCPVAYSLDLLGERWTLLMVRDLMFGPLRFSDIRDGLPGLAPNLLSDRLRLLGERGIIRQVERPSPGSRNAYELTGRGRELAPVIHALARFGVEEWTDPDTDPPPRRLLRGALLALMDPGALDDASWEATLGLGDASVSLRVGARDPADHPLNRLRLAHDDDHRDGSRTGEAVLRTSLGTLWDLRRGTTTVRTATDQGRFSYDGPSETFTRLRELFGWDR